MRASSPSLHRAASSAIARRPSSRRLISASTPALPAVTDWYSSLMWTLSSSSLAMRSSRLFSRPPAGARASLARWVGGLTYLLGIRRRVTRDNLRKALPELSQPQRDAIARGAYANMALAVIEALAFHRMAPEELAAAVEVENWPL